MTEFTAGRPSWPKWLTVAIFVATVGQLIVATFATGLTQFEGKGFAGRLAAYPLLMLLVPAIWALRRRRHGTAAPTPWTAFSLIMAPFLIDVTGNSANLYDTVVWWDDANHFLNWFLLCAGIGLLLARVGIWPDWALGLLVAGIGAVLAIGWELAEWYTFIRNGTELGTAYEDTLGDEALGTLGAALAGVLVVGLVRSSRRHQPEAVGGPPE
jgi:hypothetical protein